MLGSKAMFVRIMFLRLTSLTVLVKYKAIKFLGKWVLLRMDVSFPF